MIKNKKQFTVKLNNLKGKFKLDYFNDIFQYK